MLLGQPPPCPWCSPPYPDSTEGLVRLHSPCEYPTSRSLFPGKFPEPSAPQSLPWRSVPCQPHSLTLCSSFHTRPQSDVSRELPQPPFVFGTVSQWQGSKGHTHAQSPHQGHRTHSCWIAGADGVQACGPGRAVMLQPLPEVQRNCFHPFYFLGGSSSHGGLGVTALCG